MNSRAEYVIALVVANPGIVTLLFVSLLICATIFVSAFMFKNKELHQAATMLPFADEPSTELPGERLV